MFFASRAAKGARLYLSPVDGALTNGGELCCCLFLSHYFCIAQETTRRILYCNGGPMRDAYEVDPVSTVGAANLVLFGEDIQEGHMLSFLFSFL